MVEVGQLTVAVRNHEEEVGIFASLIFKLGPYPLRDKRPLDRRVSLQRSIDGFYNVMGSTFLRSL